MTPAREVLGEPVVRALAALALVVALGCVFHANGAFFTWWAHRGTLRDISVTGMLACGMTLVIVSGGVDLSVGSVLALAAVGVSVLTLQVGLAGPLAAAAVVAGGALFGAGSGALVARFGVQPFIVTLAAMVFARGLAKLVSAGKKVASTGQPLPGLFDALDHDLGGALPVVALLFFGCVALSHVVLTRHRVGRDLYAVGGSPEAARLSGVPVGATLIFAYAASGVFAALAGLCQAAQERQGDPETGGGYELDAIAMVVIGGTRLGGGRGSVLTTVIGALTIGTMNKVLSLNAFSTDARLMLTGGVILGAVLLQRIGGGGG